MMKRILFSIMLFASVTVAAQTYKNQETNKGYFERAYFKNKRLSTEIYHPKNQSERGYGKAYDVNGKLIYEVETSRFALLSSVSFKHHENGAIKSAHYSAHPDAGIQWYKKTTYFDEKGNITGEDEDSHDKMVTIISPYQQPPQKIQKTINQDSLNFYKPFLTKDPTGHLIHQKTVFPEYGYTLTEWKVVNRVIRQKIDFYKKAGVQSIERTFYDDGKINTESIFEEKIYHFKQFDKEGKIILEEYNRAIK